MTASPFTLLIKSVLLSRSEGKHFAFDTFFYRFTR